MNWKGKAGGWEEEDRASDQRLLDALFGDSPEAQSYRDMDPDVPSHAKLRVDEDGRPLLLRFVYVAAALLV